MLPHATGLNLHEWLSLLFIVPFVLHILFHWDWIKKMPPRLFGSIRGETRFNVVWDALLYLLMIFATISGFMASTNLLQTIGVDLQADAFWSESHHQLSNLLFPLVGVHLALHWKWLTAAFRKNDAKLL